MNGLTEQVRPHMRKGWPPTLVFDRRHGGQPFDYTGRYVSFCGGLLREDRDLLCTQRSIVYADIVNQAGKETAFVRILVSANMQAAI